MTKSDSKTKRVYRGQVTSSKMDKTLVVEIVHYRQHPKYKKRYRVSKHYHVHDGKGEYKMGDQVRFCECRPLSKTKRWYALPKTKQS